MGKRRNTAKTGDKALYSKRGQDDDAGPKRDDADPMYDEIDQFHKDKDADYLKLDNTNNADSDPDDGMTHQHNIMDLGVGGDDDDSESSSSDDEGRRGGPKAAHEDDDEDNNSDSEEASMVSSSDDDEDVVSDPRQWGRKKSTYYHGDTADLEIGQDQEDAFLEEEAAKEVQKARLADMTEDDFVLSDNDNDENQETEDAHKDKNATKHPPVMEQDLTKTRDLSKLTRKDKRKLLQKQHSELLPIVSYFSDIVKDLKTNTSVAQKALFQQEGTAEVSLFVETFCSMNIVNDITHS
jgi:U3 small nucleolar RNA-associated protein 3